MPKTCKLLTKWRNFAKSGHTGTNTSVFCCPNEVVEQSKTLKLTLKRGDATCWDMLALEYSLFTLISLKNVGSNFTFCLVTLSELLLYLNELSSVSNSLVDESRTRRISKVCWGQRWVSVVFCSRPVWQEKRHQMSIKVAQKWFH